jgi:hypothetical protein
MRQGPKDENWKLAVLVIRNNKSNFFYCESNLSPFLVSIFCLIAKLNVQLAA